MSIFIEANPIILLKNRLKYCTVRPAQYAAAPVPQYLKPSVVYVGFPFDGDICSCGFYRGFAGLTIIDITFPINYL